MDIEVSAKNVHEATLDLMVEGFKVHWSIEPDHVVFEIHKNNKHTVRKWYPGVSVKEFCRCIIKAWEKDHMSIDDLTKWGQLKDFCGPRGYEVSIDRDYEHNASVRVKKGRNTITLAANDWVIWTLDHRLEFIKSMMRIVTREDQKCSDDRQETVKWPKHNPNLDVEQLYPKMLYARANGKTQFFKEYVNSMFGVGKFEIDRVIFNEPATIVMWSDGSKTVVKADGEIFDPEKGLAMAISKKALGNKREYYHTFIHWMKKYEKGSCVYEPKTFNTPAAAFEHQKKIYESIFKPTIKDEAKDALMALTKVMRNTRATKPDLHMAIETAVMHLEKVVD